TRGPKKEAAREASARRAGHLVKSCAVSARAAAESAATTAAKTARTRAAGATRTAGARRGLRLAGEGPFALGALAGELARAADRFRLLARLLFGGFFVMAAKLHLAENPLALHLLLQRLEGLVDIVIADENLHAVASF